MSVTAEFYGGPRDGQRHALREPVRWVEFPALRDGRMIVIRYERSERVQIPPLRYDYCGEEATL